MTRPRGFALASSLALCFLLFTSADAQDREEAQPGETVAEVPVLSRFHEVIYPLWHTAWPEKNVAMLAGLLPEIRQYGDTLAKVELPGILREKQGAWNEGIDGLQAIITDYAAATSPLDSQKLLDAAERLHGQYEALVRITRPPLKELEEFHQVLYMIYHHHLPAKDQPELASSVGDLKEKMALLNSATLSKRLQKKEPAFIQARAALAESVAALDVSTAKDDFNAFKEQVEAVHSAYQALQGVFE